ncbi:hypothetical protein YC2023_105059 [Brassica napus]
MKDPLVKTNPAPFWLRLADLSVYLEPGRGDRLSSSLKQHIRKLLKVPILDSSSIKWVQPNTLVRFRGMIQDMLGNEFYAGAYKVPGQNQWTECSSVELKNRFLDLTGQKQGETCRVDEEGLMAHLRCPGLFLGQTVRKGNTKVQFSKEANNLCNLNSYNHSGYMFISKDL